MESSEKGLDWPQDEVFTIKLSANGKAIAVRTPVTRAESTVVTPDPAESQSVRPATDDVRTPWSGAESPVDAGLPERQSGVQDAESGTDAGSMELGTRPVSAANEASETDANDTRELWPGSSGGRIEWSATAPQVTVGPWGEVVSSTGGPRHAHDAEDDLESLTLAADTTLTGADGSRRGLTAEDAVEWLSDGETPAQIRATRESRQFDSTGSVNREIDRSALSSLAGVSWWTTSGSGKPQDSATLDTAVASAMTATSDAEPATSEQEPLVEDQASSVSAESETDSAADDLSLDEAVSEGSVPEGFEGTEPAPEDDNLDALTAVVDGSADDQPGSGGERATGREPNTDESEAAVADLVVAIDPVTIPIPEHAIAAEAAAQVAVARDRDTAPDVVELSDPVRELDTEVHEDGVRGAITPVDIEAEVGEVESASDGTSAEPMVRRPADAASAVDGRIPDGVTVVDIRAAFTDITDDQLAVTAEAGVRSVDVSRETSTPTPHAAPAPTAEHAQTDVPHAQTEASTELRHDLSADRGADQSSEPDRDPQRNATDESSPMSITHDHTDDRSVPEAVAAPAPTPERPVMTSELRVSEAVAAASRVAGETQSTPASNGHRSPQESLPTAGGPSSSSTTVAPVERPLQGSPGPNGASSLPGGGDSSAAAESAVESSRKPTQKRALKPGWARPPHPRILTVANQKGGVGKTTTAVNVAAALAQSGLNVLVLDIDPQGNASTALGIDHHSEVPSLYEVVVEDRPLREVVQECPDLPNLWCAPATIDLAGAEIELVSFVARETRLKKALQAYLDERERNGEEQIDYVLIDCPPSLSLLTVNAFVAAREVLIPIQCEYYALEGLSQLLKHIELIRRQLNPDLHVSTIMLTMYDARTRLSSQVADEVRRHFPEQVVKTTVPRSVRISEAPSHGQTVMTYDPTSSGALSYLEASRELAEQVLTWKSTTHEETS